MFVKIGIIILNWNGWNDTLNCIASLDSVDYPKNQISIYIVDNGSTDESVNHLRQLPGITLLELPSNIGFAAGVNFGIDHALCNGCEYVLLLNNDTIVFPDFLRQLLQIFETSATAGLVSPKIHYQDRPDRLFFAGGKFRKPRIIGELIGMGEIDEGQYDQARVVDFAVGTCLLLSRTAIEQIGYLDKRFFAYYEDIDYSIRATQAGFSVWYQPASVILHRVSHSTEGNPQFRIFLEAQSRILFFSKYIRGFNLLSVIILEMAHFVRVLLRAVLKGNIELAWGYTKGVLAGLRPLRQEQPIPR